MKFIPGPETRAAVLRHPFVLAGLAVVVLLGITAGALVVVDSARGGTEAPKVIIEQETVTPGPVISRVATNARFTIDCAGGLPDGLSADLCAKSYFGEIGRAYRHAGPPAALSSHPLPPAQV